MQLLHIVPAALLLAVATLCADASFVFSNEPVEVEHEEVAVNAFYSALAVTAVSDVRNFVDPELRPICVQDVTRVREAVFNGTRDVFIEVSGCSVDKPRGACDAAVECQTAPFELNILGPEATPGFDPEAVLRLGQTVETPYKVRSIGWLL